jgi:hypothetical protein
MVTFSFILDSARPFQAFQPLNVLIRRDKRIILWMFSEAVSFNPMGVVADRLSSDVLKAYPA